MTNKKRYEQEEIQMIVSDYDYSISMNKNALILAGLLNRSPKAVLEKLGKLKNSNVLVFPSKVSKTVSLTPSQDISAESFMTTVLNLALSRIDKEEKQKLILKLMSEI
jgi:hypothetical protein